MEHLAEFSTARNESLKDKAIAIALYEKLTTYDTFIFIHLYRDLAGTLARTTRLLQNRDIRIRDIGRWVMNLCERLKGNYPQESEEPTALLGDGTTDDILEELFGQGGTQSVIFVNR